MREYILLAIFSIGLVWYLVDILRMGKNKNAVSDDVENLNKKYKSLYLEHKITMIVVFIVLILGYVDDICKN